MIFIPSIEVCIRNIRYKYLILLQRYSRENRKVLKLVLSRYLSISVFRDKTLFNDKTCHNCNKNNHFASMCMKKKVHIIQEESNQSVETEESVGDHFFVGMASAKSSGNEITQTFYVNDQPILVKMDTGAGYNIISTEVCKKLAIPKKEIGLCNKKVVQLDGKSINVHGVCHLMIRHPNKKMYRVEFIIIDGLVPTLLGCRTCMEYGYITANQQLVNVHSIEMEKNNIPNLIKNLKNNFSELFDGGLGCLPNTVNLQLLEDAVPVVQAARRVQFSSLLELREELDKMEQLGVIEKVTKPTKWVNSLILVRKPNGKLRICLDPRALNKYIIQPKFQLHTMDEVKSRMQNAKVFALLDAANGFWMQKLDEASSDLCTFQTPFSRYKYLRMPFGNSSAPEEFVRTIAQIFENMEGVCTYMDDICVWGSSVEELNDRLIKVFKTASKNGIKFNESKCKLFVKELLYIGHKFTSEGVTPDPAKVEAIMKMETPKCKKGLEKFLGMCNYLSRYIPRYSDINQPLRELMKNDILFRWESNQEDSFNKLKIALCRSPCLTYFDTNQDITLSVDSSSTALGAVILQNGKPVAFGSRSLTLTEQNYCQLEKEMLAIVYGCVKMHQYVYGRKVFVETDHKPLETLFKKPLYKVPARLQRMMLAVQGYNLDVKYKPGREMYIADTLSRSCNKIDTENKLKELADNTIMHVKLLQESLPISDTWLKKIQDETKCDSVLCTVKSYIEKGWPENCNQLNSNIKQYWTFRDELAILDGIILKSNLVVIPRSLKNYMMGKIHEGHVGLSTCKTRARSCVFWPEINKDLDNYVTSCVPCAKLMPNNQKEPLLNHDIEPLPWYKIGMDICTFDEKYYLVMIDYYSKFIEVCKLDNLSSDCVINYCKSIFARHGIPSYVVTDCGTQFTSDKFKMFAVAYKFTHIETSPKYSQSNGMSESAVKIFKSIIKKCKEDGSDPYLGLLNYRNTAKPYLPSPAQLMYSRTLNSLIPVPLKCLRPQVPNIDKQKYEHYCDSVKRYYDRNAKPLTGLRPDQSVMFKKNMDLPWVSGRVLKRCDEPRSYLLADDSGRIYRRNRKYVNDKPKSQYENGNMYGDCDIMYDPPADTSSNADLPSATYDENLSNNNTINDQQQPYITRSGRTVKVPNRLDL